MTPAAALHEYERRLSRLRQFATMDEAWTAVEPDLPDDPKIHQGFDLGYAAGLKLAGMALTEVQTIVLREAKEPA